MDQGSGVGEERDSYCEVVSELSSIRVARLDGQHRYTGGWSERAVADVTSGVWSLGS